MLKPLRNKFILIAVLSFAAALRLILGVINTVSFYNVMANVDNRIEMLASEYSLFPDGFFSDSVDIFLGQTPLFGRRGRSDEARYDSSFFTVALTHPVKSSSSRSGISPYGASSRRIRA